ncbi:MAG: hypothetical protein AVDCRST_MAG64-2335, partial [uncultured Phycisphaerae bacterium]
RLHPPALDRSAVLAADRAARAGRRRAGRPRPPARPTRPPGIAEPLPRLRLRPPRQPGPLPRVRGGTGRGHDAV